MQRFPVRTVLPLLSLVLACLPAGIYAAITGASVSPASLNAGAVSDVTVSLTVSVGVQVGNSVLVDFPTGFQIPSDTTVAVQTAGSSTTLSVAAVSTAQISVLVEGATISADAAFSFTIANVRNVGAQTTGDFTISTYDDSNILLETDSAVPGVAISSTTLGDADVAPVSPDAGVVGKATVTFRSAVGLPVGSLVKITFPSDFHVASTALSDASNIDGTVTVSGSDVIVEVVTSAVAADTVVAFKLDGVTNPSARTTGAFMVATMDSSLKLFQQSDVIAGIPISSTTLAGADVVPVSLSAGVVGKATVTFRSAVGLPVGSLVKITFPSDFHVASTALSDASNIDGTVTVSGSDVIVEVVTSAVVADTVVAFKLDGVTNPSARTTGAFMVATMDTWLFLYEESDPIDGVAIVSPPLSPAVVKIDCLNGGVVGTATVSFTSAVELPVGSLVKVTFPSDFQIASTALSDVSNIDGSSAVQVTGSVVTITIASTAVVANAVVSLKLDGVTNPGAKTTGTFAVETMDSSLLLFQQSGLIAAVTIESTTLADATVIPDTLEAGVVDTATVTFTSSVGLPVGSLVKITFPRDFSVAATTISATSSIDSSSVINTSGSVVTVTISNTAVAIGASVSFKLDGLTNPGATTTGTFAVATTDSSSKVFEQATAISGVTIDKTTLVGAAVKLDSLDAGVVGKAAVSFANAVGLPVGSFVKVAFPDDFQVASTALSDTSNIEGTVTMSGSEVIITITSNAVAKSAVVSFKLDGVTNPGAKTTDTFVIATMDSSSNVFQQSDPIAAATIKSTTLAGVSVQVDNNIAGVESIYDVSFEMKAAIPVGGYFVLTVPSDYILSGSITLVDPTLPGVWDGTINGQGIKFKALSLYAAGQHSIQVKFLQNPGTSTTGSFTLSTTDAREFPIENADCGGVQIVPGLITDAVLTPQLAHPGIVSRVDVSFTASAGLAEGGHLNIYLPAGDYDAAVPILSVVVATPAGISATASWKSSDTAILVSFTSPITVAHGAAVALQVTALEMPQSIRASSTAGTMESWNAEGLQLDKSNTLSLSALTAVTGLPCTWATETPNPGITSNVLVTFKTNGMIPVGGKIVLTLPASDFYADSVGNTPSVVFKNPSTVVVATSIWDKASNTLEVVTSGDSIPAYTTGVQVKILKLDTPMSVRTASRLPASLTTLDPLGIEIDGPSVLQLDAITAGFILGSRVWTAANAVPGVTSVQTVDFFITGRMDPGGKFEFTLPDSQWSMAATTVATFIAPALGAVGSVVWNEPTRMMTVTLTGTTSIPAYTGVTLTIEDVTNPPKETGINNAYLTTRAADDSIIDGPDSVSVMTISRGALVGAKTWTAVTSASASVKSDQLLRFTLSGALPSGSIILATLPTGGWRMVDSTSVSVSFSLPATGVTVQSATWFASTYKLQLVTSGDLVEGASVELLVKDMINPFSSSAASVCTVTTMLADLGVVDESKDIVVNPVVSEALPTEGSWTSTKSTPGVLSTQTLTFTTGGKLEPDAKFCITGDVWTLMASTSASMTLAGSGQPSLLKLTFDSRTLCMQTPVGIDYVTDVTIVLTDILSPQSVRLDRTEPLLIHSHLGGDVNTGSIRLNAVTEGALTGPLTWKTLFFSPGPVAGLKTSANLALRTTGQIDAGGYIKVELPSEWVMASTCTATFVRPSVLGQASCSQNQISIRLQDSLNEATDLDILFVGVYNPPTVMPEGTTSSWTIATDGGKIDESNSITTGAILCAVTGVTNSGDHLVAVVGAAKTFAFDGSALAQGDVIKFVDASTTSDANCGVSTTGQSDVGGIGVKFLSASQDVTLKFTQSSPDGQPFAICYKFGENPFKLYPALSIAVKEVKSVTAAVGSSNIAVVDFVKTWIFGGNGIVAGDQVRWIDLDVVESAAYVSTPPDCLDTSTLAKLSAPNSGALNAPEDDYTRVVGVGAATSYAFSVESSGKTYCLCYKFGSEPFKVYPLVKVEVNHLRSIEATSTGSDTVVVVNAPKTFIFFGDGVSSNDRLYFVEKGSVSSCTDSNNDPTLQLTHFVDEQVRSTLFISSDLVTGVNFEASAAGMTVVPCYQFGLEPYQLYPEIRLTVKMITKYTGTLGSPKLAVVGVPEPLTFLGYGLSGGDKVRWILRGEEDCESSLASLTQPTTPEFVDTITLDSNNAGLFTFASTQSDFNPALCYKFGEENFVLYPDISIGIGTIRGKATLTGATDVAVVGSRKVLTLLGTNLAEGDRVGWTAVLDSGTPCSKLSVLIANPLNTDNDYLSYLTSTDTFGVAMASLSSGKRVYLCYGFGQEPFKLFPDLYLNVKSVTNMRALVSSPSVAVAGAIKTFLFDGDGVATGDFAKFVSSDSQDCSVPGVSLLNIIKEFDDYDEMAMYLYEIGDSTTTGSFQVSSDKSSAGLDRVLCYRFGAEPFAYYEHFRIDVKTIWGLLRTDKTGGGQDNVMVVDEPKQMTIDGIGMSVKDALKFVLAADDSGDADCVDLPAQGQNNGRLQVNADLTVWLPFEFGSEGGTWALCYKFDDEPYRLYPSVAVTVKEITALLDYTFQDIEGLGGVATIGHRKEWNPVGSGIQQGDTVKIVTQSVTSSSDCGKGGANATSGTSVMTVGSKLMFSGIISAYPASTSDVYHLCYQFQDEPFTYLRGFTLTTYGITNLDRSVVLLSATTTAQITGFRISDTDEMGWTTSSTDCSTMLGRTQVSGSKGNVFFKDSYTLLYFCYSFDRQPFDVFKTVTLAVVKAEIWSPQTVSIIADQTAAIAVSGTFGITQGTDQIAWVPSDVVECSPDAVAQYAGVMQTSVASVAKSQSIIPRAGGASFNAKYVAPSSASGMTATDSFSTWKLCYRFGTTPSYLMFGDVLCTVLNIVQVLLISQDPTSSGAVLKFEFDGIGMQDFDAAKWVDASAASTDEHCSSLPAVGGSKIRDVVNSRATFTFVEESTAMALCYRFLGHAFKLYANIPIQSSVKTTASSEQSSTGAILTSYDEEAVAAASDQFTASREIATISLTLDKDIGEIPAGSNAERDFKASFVATLATSLGIDPSRIQITGLVAGSVVVNFQLLASANPADPSVSEAVQDLHTQLTDTRSKLLSTNTVVVKNAATALSVTLATPPLPAASPVAIQALGYQSNGLFSFVRSIYSVTEKSSKLTIPIVRLQGTASALSIKVQVQTTGTSAIYGDNYAFPPPATFDGSLKLLYLTFKIGQALQTIELDILDDNVKGVHFKTLSLALLNPQTAGATLGSTKETVVRIYDYDEGVSLANSSFTTNSADLTDQQHLQHGWQVVGNGASPLRVDGNGLFAVDDVLGEAEYNQKCDLAAPTGVCSYSCELGGGLTSALGLEAAYNVLALDGDDYVASMNAISAFPSEALTVSLWVKTTQTNPAACLYSYAATAPAVPLALCNPSNLQLFIDAESDVSGLSTFVNVSDNAWHFLAVTWTSADGRVRVFDNGMLVFDGGPYREGKALQATGFLVVGHLVLSSTSKAPCTVAVEAATASTGTSSLLTEVTEDVRCNVVTGSGFKGQVQHVHVWSRVLARSELLGELAWPLRVASNGLVLGWNFATSFLLRQGRVVNDLSMQGQEQKNLGVLHCSSQNLSSLQLASTPEPNTSSTGVDRCLLRGEVPRLDATFPCGPVFANVWHFSAPAAFTTKLAAAYGGRLQFRLLAPSFNGSPRPRRGQVAIFGKNADGIATQMSVALGSFDLPSASRWTYYSVVLREDFGWITEPDGASITAAAFKAVLGGATRLWIRGDIWGYDPTGAGQEVVYLNDVVLLAR
ncbi:hypothetical protein PRIC1_014460 [Phytophthora ramorum]